MFVSSAIITPFFERWFTLKVWVAFIVILSDRSISDCCMLFIYGLFVSLRLTYCSFIFSVYSSFIVISACSSFSTSFLKSKCGSRIEEG